nr:helix-turn-helix transcriptional regulator [uncultured Enterobacter sp.]
MSDFTRTMTDNVLAAMLYKRIESRRKAMKVTQLALAERIGITAKTYRTLKEGKCSVIVLIAILRELQLIENLEALVPTEQTRPGQVWSKMSSERRKSDASSQADQVRSMLKARKKMKTRE